MLNNKDTPLFDHFDGGPTVRSLEENLKISYNYGHGILQSCLLCCLPLPLVFLPLQQLRLPALIVVAADEQY